MKCLSLYLFLILFTLQTPSQADDIQDIQIEGMSVGESLLKYIDKEEIENGKLTDYSGSKKFSRISKSFQDSIYDDIQFHFKTNDPKYIIHSIEGVIYFENDIPACLNKQKEVATTISKEISGKVIKNDAEKKIDREGEHRSTIYPQYIVVIGGYVDFVCYDWTKKYEGRPFGYSDSLKISLTTDEMDKWINTEAF